MLHLRDVEVEGVRTDVCVVSGRVAGIGHDHCGHPPDSRPTVIEGYGGGLIPGLHDHHLHVLALAAAWSSVDCGVGGLDTLRDAPDGAWVRGVNAVVSVDRHVLDRFAPERPVRVQHRSGGLWMLNSAALRAVAHVLDDTPDVERDQYGTPTGRLWRYDARLRPALPTVLPDLVDVGRRLARLGITGVTDATPNLDDDAVRALRTIPQRLLMLGDPVSGGPWKLLLRDHDLPDYDDLVARVAACHAEGRPVAVHAVTRESLLLALAVLEDVGTISGDRIEHAAICPPEAVEWLARMNLAVVTQPDFLRTRGGAYLRNVRPDDVPHLYPYSRLLHAGVRTTASSDAPFGEVDPWQVIATASGRPIGPEENVPALEALGGYLSAPLDPGGPGRRIGVGAAADLVLLQAPLEDVLRTPNADQVRATWIGGRSV